MQIVGEEKKKLRSVGWVGSEGLSWGVSKQLVVWLKRRVEGSKGCLGERSCVEDLLVSKGKFEGVFKS